MKGNFWLNIVFKFILGLCLISTGCNQPDKNSEETDSGKVTVDSVTIAKALSYGFEIAEAGRTLLASKLKPAIEQQGIEFAIQYCNLNAYPLIDSLQERYYTIIRRASRKFRNPSNAPTENENQILLSYSASLKEGVMPDAQAVLVDDNFVLYARPILLNNPLCLKCHGVVGEDIIPEDYKIIQSLYPEDNATGYSINELRGIWSITLPLDSLIKE